MPSALQSYREKATTAVLFKDVNLFLLAFDSPWQRNDTIAIFLAFVFLGIGFFFFFQKTLRDMITLFAASIRAKFEQFLWERFGNISERSFKGHKKKNSETTT